MIPGPRYHNSHRRFSVPIIVVLLTVILGAGGCSIFSPVGDFISQRYENVVSYFNTYYNASTAFDDAESEVIKQQETLRAKDQPIKLGDISQTAKQKFDLSIEKLSRLLTFYPTSKWVDRSLFMIGKAYYYKGDLVRAERKFRELITTMPSSDYVNSATFWLGQSLSAANQLKDAKKELAALIPRAYEQGENRIGGEAGLLLGQTCLTLADSSGALSAFQAVIDQSRDGALSAEAQLSIAEIISVNGEPENVLTAFAKVRDFKPEIVTEYKARLRFAQYMTKIGRYDDAINELQYLLDRPEYIEFIAQIKYSLAYAFHQKGNIADALPLYVEIDSLYPHTDAAAQSYFQRAIIQQKDSGNYKYAATLYDRAKTENPQSTITQKAGLLAESLRKYIQLRTKIALCDTLLGRYAKPDSTNKNSQDEKLGQDSLKTATATINDTTQMTGSKTVPVQETVLKDSLSTETKKTVVEKGNRYNLSRSPMILILI